MSGICGIFNLDGAPVRPEDLCAMTFMLQRRGPDGTTHWREGPVGFGHTLLTTTPGLAREPQPVVHSETGCVVTADVRLDNREDLLRALGLMQRAEEIGDAGLILEAYLKWGNDCAGHLLGDFAFALWNPRLKSLLTARDQFGMRPLYYYQAARKVVIFSSEPDSINVLRQVPYRISEERIADALVPALEWIDYTSTFFQDVFRLPAGYRATATRDSFCVSQHRDLAPVPVKHFSSDSEYVEGFLDVITRAVDRNLKTAGRVASMLSGGLDSASIVALATRDNVRADGFELPTLSGVSADAESCAESQGIYAATKTLQNIEPHFVSTAKLIELLPDLADLWECMGEPFDSWMVLSMALYQIGAARGCNVVLDGGAGDLAIDYAPYLSRALRRGQWWEAGREAFLLDEFGEGRSGLRGLLKEFKAGYTGGWMPEIRERRYRQQQLGVSFIDPSFASAVDIDGRFRKLRAHYQPYGYESDEARFRAQSIRPNMVGGRERYNRLASLAGVEPRDPYLDQRVIEYCLSLPGSMRIRDGWPKYILRIALNGRLSREVLWSRRKKHIGLKFTSALISDMLYSGRLNLEEVQHELKGYTWLGVGSREQLSDRWGRAKWLEGNGSRDLGELVRVVEAIGLATWLRRHRSRPACPY